MHRDVITHLVVTKSDFIITGSIDGHIKFWKKMEEGIEFVKHFRSHLSNYFRIFRIIDNIVYKFFTTVPIHSLTSNYSGTFLCSASEDKSVKIFDVINFDMINIIKLDFMPLTTCWIAAPGEAIQSLAM